MARTKNASVPEVGSRAPEFSLPSAQGGNLRLSLRTVRGPVVVAFLRGLWSKEDVEFFRALAAKEDEINVALGTVVGICVAEPDEARELQRATKTKSYILYDYTMDATRDWGLLERDAEHGYHARPATFLVDGEGRISSAWTDARPAPEEILARVSELTGLPKQEEPEDAEDAAGTGGDAASGESTGKEKTTAEARTSRKRAAKTEVAESGTEEPGAGKPGEEAKTGGPEEGRKRTGEAKASDAGASEAKVEGESGEKKAKAEGDESP